MALRQWANDTLAEAMGQDRRYDPVLPGTGGPAGNARLTAWTGLVLLVLFLLEVATLLKLGALLDWHVIVGILLVPPALLKTVSTGWRIVRYYTKDQPYWRAGPPPMLLRLLGPLVVLFTLAVLGSGLALIALGPADSRVALFSMLGHEVSAVTVHAGTFVLWAVVTGLHTLGRVLPAYRIVTTRTYAGHTVPGKPHRIALFAVTLAIAGCATAILIGAAGPWLSGEPGVSHQRHPSHSVAQGK